jgi:hypothetical protein
MSRVVLVLLASAALACTTVDPDTGEEKIDPLPTAAAIGGAAALGTLIFMTADDDDDDHHHHHRGHGYGKQRRWYRPFSPAHEVVCYPSQQRCYNDGDYSKKWTRRVFDD